MIERAITDAFPEIFLFYRVRLLYLQVVSVPIHFEDTGAPNDLKNKISFNQASTFYLRAMNAVAAGGNQKDGKMIDHHSENFLSLNRCFDLNCPCP